MPTKSFPLSIMSDDEDFKLQLELEAREAAAKAAVKPASSSSDASTAGPANPYLYTDPTGCQYEWDHMRRAWIPKIDDDFLARYQAAYGFPQEQPATQDEKPAQSSSNQVERETDNEAAATEPSDLNDDRNKDGKGTESGEQQAGKGRGKRKAELEKPAEWFDVDDDHNTNVYVSNLPLDTTEEEFVELMSKYGLIMKDMSSNKNKIKMYRDHEGNFKGDALCTFIKVESVQLALQLLDESLFKNNVIHVERAKFTLKGEYDASKKPKKKNQDKRKMKKKMEK